MATLENRLTALEVKAGKARRADLTKLTTEELYFLKGVKEQIAVHGINAIFALPLAEKDLLESIRCKLGCP